MDICTELCVTWILRVRGTHIHATTSRVLEKKKINAGPGVPPAACCCKQFGGVQSHSHATVSSVQLGNALWERSLHTSIADEHQNRHINDVDNTTTQRSIELTAMLGFVARGVPPMATSSAHKNVEHNKNCVGAYFVFSTHTVESQSCSWTLHTSRTVAGTRSHHGSPSTKCFGRSVPVTSMDRELNPRRIWAGCD